MNVNWIKNYIDMSGAFPKPDWNSIENNLAEHFEETDLDLFWSKAALFWVEEIQQKLSADYLIHETENFIILSSEKEKYINIYKKFLEGTLKKILSTLHHVANDDGYGKHVVLIFEDIDSYYSYTSPFYPEEGEFGLSSGAYLNNGYGHFVFPHLEALTTESVTAHEMTHALVSHLPIPLWLNEGMAVTIETFITGYAVNEMNIEMLERHREFWGAAEIQEFWSGDSFSRTDEGQELSYHLAEMAVKSLSHDYNSFIDFANKADYLDGGQSAANEVYEVSIGNLLSQFFGVGDWEPRPETWNKEA